MMWQSFWSRSVWIALLSTLTLLNSACSKSEAESVSSPTPTQAASPVSTPSASVSPKPQASIPLPPPPPESDTYEEAVDVATSAVTISQSAVSREDWQLVANRWQEAIQLLKAVPASSKNHSTAQQKLSQYQNLLADAKQRSTPPPPKPKQGDNSPQFFSVPIKGKLRGIPIIEVTFNDKRQFSMLFDTGATNTLITQAIASTLNLKPVGITQMGVADGAIVQMPVAILESMEVDGRLKRKIEVAIAPPSMPVGLLGHDFFDGYDITIKDDVIEFRKRS
ncbi:retropepsin-like aspartic protease family protein [Coleofasciculus sp. G2-EDA-02]|uniref:retropepsin-like aspartic protease family protein n=1 Tax=Coleofasciculus sp. G2-EDA-02 TaxID=3069529 RepID=UPI0032F9C638